MNPTEVKDLLNSLSPDKGQAEPQEMHGYRFDIGLDDLNISWMRQNELLRFAWYLMERCRRAESREVPDLKEKVADFGRYCLHVATEAAEHPNNEDKQRPYEILSHICAPEEVKP